jgi:hypothetical protein
VERPYLLIDVDGVLNPIDPSPELGFERYRFRGLEVHLASIHGKWLRGLGTWFDLVWCTTWETQAPRHFGPILGLSDLPVIRFTSRYGKLPDVVEFVGDRPCAWIDDRIKQDDRDWAAGRQIPTLLVQPDPMVGMTDLHREELEIFGRSLAEHGT